MKKFLLSLTLFTALLGITLSASAAPCTTSNLIFTVKKYIDNGNGTYTVTFDIGWDQANNGGYNFSASHLWQTGSYPSYPYTSPGGTRPTATFLNSTNSLGSVILSRKNKQSPWEFSNYPDGQITLLTGTLQSTPINNGDGTRFFISDVILTVNVPQESFSVKGDIWGSQSGNNVSCHDADKTFLPPLAEFNISGSITCSYLNGLPDNKFKVQMTSNAAQASPYTVNYTVYVDKDGSGIYTPNDEWFIKTESNIAVFAPPPGTYQSELTSYAPYSQQYAYRNSAIHIVANVAYTQNGGGQFTRTITLSNTCETNSPVPPPIGNPDYFVLGMDGWEGNTSLKAHVYGNYTKWSNDPIVADYQVESLESTPAVSGGTDGDNTDAPLSAMKFTFSGLTLVNGPACESQTPNLGNLTTDEKGFFEYTLGDPCVNQVSFTYSIRNTITDLSTGPITVIIEINDPVILPVTYASFTANRANNSQVVLEWETAMEENNKGFHVQRNVNGEWKNIGFVFTQADKGNSSARLKYQFKDANSSKGISQYRILQVDNDGKGRYSEVRSIRGEEMATRLTLFPNPSNTGAFSILFEDASSLRDVFVTDVSGRVVKQYKGISSSSLSVDGLSGGFYTVQVRNHTTGSSAVEKVIIKKR